ncbi:unnamed protein product [Phytophthora lilii]|uniref:Unnamed protein product n=1 Tax=Phytophthora lilii TaxID=2077276 RepID=A0A9W6TPU5_9STRA|nr:unnamed protein product [Phytophthora lilii]
MCFVVPLEIVNESRPPINDDNFKREVLTAFVEDKTITLVEVLGLDYEMYDEKVQIGLIPGPARTIGAASRSGRCNSNSRSRSIARSGCCICWTERCVARRHHERHAAPPLKPGQRRVEAPQDTGQYVAYSSATTAGSFSRIFESYSDGPLVSTGKIDSYTTSKDYEYLLELDANYNIIGGE